MACFDAKQGVIVMKRLILTLVVLACGVSANAATEVVVVGPPRSTPLLTVGLAISKPEIAGLYLSLLVPSFALVSADARLTLSSVEGGLSLHIPLATGPVRHSVVVTGLGGYVHGGVNNEWMPHHHGRLIGMAGYGLMSTWDLRIQAGMLAQHTFAGQWVQSLAAQLMIGKVF
jgi:hypothetical protein